MKPDQYARQKELRKEKLANPSRYTCDCGSPAVRMKCSSWICQRCIDLEAQFYGLNVEGKKISLPRHGASPQ